jgi:hypothetical protein
MGRGIDRVIYRQPVGAISTPSLQRSLHPNDPFSMIFRRVTAESGVRKSGRRFFAKTTRKSRNLERLLSRTPLNAR